MSYASSLRATASTPGPGGAASRSASSTMPPPRSSSSLAKHGPGAAADAAVAGGSAAAIAALRKLTADHRAGVAAAAHGGSYTSVTTAAAAGRSASLSALGGASGSVGAGAAPPLPLLRKPISMARTLPAMGDTAPPVASSSVHRAGSISGTTGVGAPVRQSVSGGSNSSTGGLTRLTPLPTAGAPARALRAAAANVTPTAGTGAAHSPSRSPSSLAAASSSKPPLPAAARGAAGRPVNTDLVDAELAATPVSAAKPEPPCASASAGKPPATPPTIATNAASDKRPPLGTSSRPALGGGTAVGKPSSSGVASLATPTPSGRSVVSNESADRRRAQRMAVIGSSSSSGSDAGDEGSSNGSSDDSGSDDEEDSVIDPAARVAARLQEQRERRRAEEADAARLLRPGSSSNFGSRPSTGTSAGRVGGKRPSTASGPPSRLVSTSSAGAPPGDAGCSDGPFTWPEVTPDALLLLRSAPGTLEVRGSGQFVYHFPQVGYYACANCHARVASASHKIALEGGMASFAAYAVRHLECGMVVRATEGRCDFGVACGCGANLGALDTRVGAIGAGSAPSLVCNSRCIVYCPLPYEAPEGVEDPLDAADGVFCCESDSGSGGEDGGVSHGDGDDDDDDDESHLETFEGEFRF